MKQSSNWRLIKRKRGISSLWNFSQVKDQESVQELIQLLDLRSAELQLSQLRPIAHGEDPHDLFCAGT